MNLPPPPGERFDDPPKSRTLFYLLIAGGTLLGFCCIGGAILGLFFPAIGKVREAANRAKSQNNLRQIGMGIQSYHDADKDQFPYICDFGPASLPGGGMYSLHGRILIYVEGGDPQPFYTAELYCGSPQRMAAQTIRAYLSPFESGADENASLHSFTVEAPAAVPPHDKRFTGWYSTTNYVANGMVFSPQPDGKRPSLKTVIDGTSQTMMLAERLQVCKSATGDVPTLWGLGAYSAATASFALPVPQGEYPKTTNANLELKQFIPGQGGTMPPGFQLAPAPGQCDPRIMQTLHSGGMIVAMFDGSCRTIAPSITPATFWAGVTPWGDETVGDDW